MNKRPRTEVVVAKTKRPVDKISYLLAQNISTTPAEAIIYTQPANSSSTFSGGWVTGTIGNITGQQIICCAVLYYKQQGMNSPSISVTNATPIYQPEQNSLWSTCANLPAAGVLLKIESKIKTQRKLKGGDIIAVQSLATVNNVVPIALHFTLFFKE